MKKVFRHTSHLVVIAALIFSSVGFTTISLSCPMGKKMEAGCPKCKRLASDLVRKDACCKTTITHTVLKTEFEKLDEVRTVFSHHACIPVIADASYFAENTYSYTPSRSFKHSTSFCLSPAEKCALLSIFRI